MEKRTIEEIKQNLLLNLQSLNPEATALLNLQDGSRIRDLLICNGVEIKTMEDVLESIYNDIFVISASEEALEKKLIDRGLSRLGGLYSQCYVNIGSLTQPTQTIIIPTNFEVSTSDDTPIIFRTKESGSIGIATPIDTKGYYTTSLLCESLIQSDDANVSIESINKIITNISGINVVYNLTSATGGREKESIESMRNRLEAITKDIDRGTTDWFITQTLQNFTYALSVIVERSPYGNGSIILYIATTTGLTPPQKTEIYDYFMDDIRSDAAGWNIEVEDVENVLIDLTMTVYRSNIIVDYSYIESLTQDYFETLDIGEDFIKNRYISYMLDNSEYIVDIDITVPSSSRVTIESYQLAKLGVLTVTAFIDTTLE